MPKTWIPWNDIDYSSSKHNVNVKQKAYYDSTPSKSIGGGGNIPELGMDDVMWISDPANPSPTLTDITMVDDIASGLTKEDRLAIVHEWVQVKERELARRKDARFVTTAFIPIPNELSARDAVKVGHEICRSLFEGDHLYSFSVHSKETTVKKKIAGGAVATYSRQNNHIHIIFTERRLSDGRKGTGAARKFKGHDALRKMINAALAESLIKRGYKITANAGDQKKKRISRAQQRAREREEQQALAVQQIELEAKEKRDEIAGLDKEIAVMEREVTAMEKGRQLPNARKVNAALDQAAHTQDEIRQQLDAISQRSQARIKEAEKYRSSRTTKQPEREPGDRGIDR